MLNSLQSIFAIFHPGMCKLIWPILHLLSTTHVPTPTLIVVLQKIVNYIVVHLPLWCLKTEMKFSCYIYSPRPNSKFNLSLQMSRGLMLFTVDDSRCNIISNVYTRHVYWSELHSHPSSANARGHLLWPCICVGSTNIKK